MNDNIETAMQRHALLSPEFFGYYTEDGWQILARHYCPKDQHGTACPCGNCMLYRLFKDRRRLYDETRKLAGTVLQLSKTIEGMKAANAETVRQSLAAMEKMIDRDEQTCLKVPSGFINQAAARAAGVKFEGLRPGDQFKVDDANQAAGKDMNDHLDKMVELHKLTSAGVYAGPPQLKNVDLNVGDVFRSPRTGGRLEILGRPSGNVRYRLSHGLLERFGKWLSDNDEYATENEFRAGYGTWEWRP